MGSVWYRWLRDVTSGARWRVQTRGRSTAEPVPNHCNLCCTSASYRRPCRAAAKATQRGTTAQRRHGRRTVAPPERARGPDARKLARPGAPRALRTVAGYLDSWRSREGRGPETGLKPPAQCARAALVGAGRPSCSGRCRHILSLSVDSSYRTLCYIAQPPDAVATATVAAVPWLGRLLCSR